MILQISVAVIAVAFVVLVVFVVRTLQAAEQSLNKTTQTLQEVQQTVDELSYELKQVVRQANDISGDVKHKMNQIDPVMESVKNVGEVLSEVTSAAKQVSSAVVHRFQKSSQQIKKEATASITSVDANAVNSGVAAKPASTSSKKQDWTKWVDIAATIWQKYRS